MGALAQPTSKLAAPATTVMPMALVMDMVPPTDLDQGAKTGKALAMADDFGVRPGKNKGNSAPLRLAVGRIVRFWRDRL